MGVQEVLAHPVYMLKKALSGLWLLASCMGIWEGDLLSGFTQSHNLRLSTVLGTRCTYHTFHICGFLQGSQYEIYYVKIRFSLLDF